MLSTQLRDTGVDMNVILFVAENITTVMSVSNERH